MNNSPAPRERPSWRWASPLVLLLIILTWLSFAPAGAPGHAVKRFISFTTGFCSSCARQEIDPSVPFVKSMSGAPVAPDLEEKAKQFALETHVQIVEDEGRFNYLLHARGEPIKLFSTDASLEGLQEGRSKLAGVIDAKLKALQEGDLKASFALENELVEEQKSLAGANTDSPNGEVKGDAVGEAKSGKAKEATPIQAKRILARTPRLDELWGVEAALARSKPSHLAPGDRLGIKFYFLKDPLYKEEPGYAYYTTDKDGRKAIYVTPGATDKLRPTDADAPVWARPTRFKPGGHYFDTIESLMLHELAHNHQERMGWENGDEVMARMTASLGYVKAVDPQTGVRVFYLKVPLAPLPASAPPAAVAGSVSPEEAAGATALPAQSAAEKFAYYRVERPVDQKLGKRWLRVNLEGQYLDRDGKVVAAAKAEAISNADMQKLALVKPASNYFDNPIEVFAEGMRLFRMGGEARDTLFVEAPLVYQLVKEEDQAELNLFYGFYKVHEKRTLHKAGKPVTTEETDSDQPVYTRNWNGELVKYSGAVADDLRTREAQLSGK